MMSTGRILRPHSLKIVLISPQIAPNTGNVARLCVASGTALHLVRPLGFVLSDKQLRRSAMDYWLRLKLTVHDDLEAWKSCVPAGENVWLFDSGARTDLWDATFVDGDWLVFGSETRGIDPALLDADPDHAVRIAHVEGERCLNLATSAGIALYEALRRFTV